MKLRKLAVSLCTVALLAGCGSSGGSSDAEDKTLRIGASVTPHAEIIRHIQPILEEKGYTVEITEFTDYNKPNQALVDGELDANFFQHQPYLEEWSEKAGVSDKLTSVLDVHFEPLGIYSTKHDKLEVKDGDVISIPNDTTNGGRALKLLEDNGIITLKEGVGVFATVQDIEKYNVDVEITELVAEQCAIAIDDVDYAVVNGNNALNAKISDKLLVSEDANSESAKTYPNVIAVQTEHKDDQKIKDLVEALNTEDVKTFIEESYDGIVVPLVPAN